MVGLELYEIVHERNPLRHRCTRMISGRMEVPWYYTSVTFYFAKDAGSLSFQLGSNTDALVQMNDTSTRWWFPLRQDESYHTAILQKISDCEKQSSVHGPSNLPLSKMLYDMILYKILYYDRDRVNESWRRDFAPVMLRYLAHHTIEQDAEWVDKVIEEGWTQTGGVLVCQEVC